MSTLVDKKTIANWVARPVRERIDPSAHALTVDVEDYFQVEAFFRIINREDWDRLECRVERNVDCILQMFDRAGAKATFFTLGWIAERYPAMVRTIVAAGHELASHGMAHRRADSQSRPEFYADVLRSRNTLEDIGGVPVKGYRAPSFSITARNLWALDALEEAGYRYSSSINPIRHDLYGIPEAPRFAFYPLSSRNFVEIPITSVAKFGRNWPCGGGGFFRLLPYSIFLNGLRSVEKRDRQSCIFYFHPWEIDPDQPRIRGAPLKSRIRHYMNLGKMADRLERLLREFTWKRVDQIYPVAVPLSMAA